MVVHIVCMVPYVPTNNRTVKKMIAAAKLTKKDVVFDLGCGDGRLLIAAEKNHVKRSIGFEIAPLVYLLALARKFLSKSKAQIKFKNFFDTSISDATVVFCYLIPAVMPNLATKLQTECKKGTRIISNTFQIIGMTPYKVLKKNPVDRTPSIYIYHV